MMMEVSNAVKWVRSTPNHPMRPKFNITAELKGIMDKIPNYASVHSTVEASKKSSKIFSKTVNAILIKFIKNNGKINFKNLEHNYHCNILSEWKGQYSKEELKSLYAWNNTIPTIWFHIKKEFDRKDKRMKIHMRKQILKVLEKFKMLNC